MGKVTRGALERLGIHTIEQLRKLSLEVLTRDFGKRGEHFWKLARGIDDRAVLPDREAKSISHETTFSTDISDKEFLRAQVLELTQQTMRQLRRQKKRARTVHLKIRFANFQTITRSRTLANATDVTAEVCRAARELHDDALSVEHLGVRLVGVGVSKLCGNQLMQMTLFGDECEPQEQTRQRRLDAVSDIVRDRFGDSALSNGGQPSGARPPERKSPA